MNIFENMMKLYRKKDPVSSKIAAEKIITSGKKDTHENIILDTLFDDGDFMTTHEIASECSLSNEQIHKRMKELEESFKIQRGLIRKCSITNELMTEWRAVKPK